MTLDDAAIEQLVTAARSGDAESFARLFDRYHGPVYRFVASRIRQPHDAEDVTQLVFVKALEALPRYESRGVPFGGWLFRLARNAVIDFVRTHRDHAELDGLLERSGADPGPHDVVALRADLHEVGQALGRLTDEQRDVIALRFFAGLSAREAAEAMGKQEGTIRGLQFRALAALRRELGIEVTNDGPGAPPTGGGRSRRR
ncbi:MAG TPA: sigma-70 family RNA polymerase sigma factor [Candidatus Limnocylindrales bacterium]